MIEVLKQALEALEDATKHIFLGDKNGVEANIRAHKQCESLRQAIAELESQEPDVVMHWHSHTWTTINPPPKNSGDVNLYYSSPQRTEERNFCPRCGKRTADLTVIHTCTPPQD